MLKRPANDEQIDSKEQNSWRSSLMVTNSGSPKPLLANAITAFRDAPVWHSVLCYDAFGMQTVLDLAPPWDDGFDWRCRVWTPQDDLLATDWLQRQGIGVNVATVAQAVEAVARDRQFHPVIDHLESLQHDGKTRIDSWLTTLLGAAPSLYNEYVGRAILVAAVARIYQPGCKVDNVPIFAGAQGTRKSTMIKTMFYPWFTDELADLGSKDAAMQTRGSWGIEISELDAMSRSDVSKIKAFISRTTDRFRPPYGNRIIESERACVFWGSTNAEGYLKDETGARRFWPIKVGKIDIDGLTEARDQLWAEARKFYENGYPWWIIKPEVLRAAEEQQSEYYVGDPWDAAIERYVTGEAEVTIEKVLRDALSIELSRCTQIEMNRVSRCLRVLGFLRFQRRSGDKRVWVYRKPVTSGDESRPANNVTTLKPVTTTIPVTQEVLDEQQQ